VLDLGTWTAPPLSYTPPLKNPTQPHPTQTPTQQVAVIEFARNVLGLTDADSTEFNAATAHPAVVFMPEISTQHMGGTMRLGARRTVLQTMNCITAKLYQKEHYIDERHRHRYEVNPELVGRLEEAGLIFVGKDETGACVAGFGMRGLGDLGGW